jgi:hypothetical protein
VGFAPRRDAEQLSKTACHGMIVRKINRAVKSGFISREGREVGGGEFLTFSSFAFFADTFKT